MESSGNSWSNNCFRKFCGGNSRSVLNENLHLNQITTEPLGTSLLRFALLPPSDEYPLPKENQDRVLAFNDYDSVRRGLEGEFRVDEQGNKIPLRVVDREGNLFPAYFMHNYIHGVVGGGYVDFSTAPPTPNPLGTMSNVLSSPNDPVFWLVHANIDRLWAEWQEDGHTGSNFYPSNGQPYGHNLNDLMWPWDGGQSSPGKIGPGDFLSLLPRFAKDDLVTPADTLDIKQLDYTYDTLSHTSIPEPTSN